MLPTVSSNQLRVEMESPVVDESDQVVCQQEIYRHHRCSSGAAYRIVTADYLQSHSSAAQRALGRESTLRTTTRDSVLLWSDKA